MSGQQGHPVDDLDLRLDPRFERTLLGVLDARDPGPAPRALRERVDGVPAEVAAGQQGRLRRVVPYLAVAAALVVLIGGLGALGTGRPGGVGGGGGTATTFDPYATGIGVVEAPSQVLVVVVIAAFTALAFYGAGVLGGRKGGVLALLFLVIPGVFLLSQLVPPPVASGGGYSTDSGVTDGTELGYTYGAVPGGVVVVKPGEPYRFVVEVANRGPLPLRLDGMVEIPASTPGVTDLPALWLGLDPETSWSTPDTPFTPRWLAPGASVSLWVVQRASSCTVPAGPGVASSSQSAIAIRWSALGVVPRMDALQLPYLVDTPLSVPCPTPQAAGS